jgi:Tol biopolymer transport system component
MIQITNDGHPKISGILGLPEPMVTDGSRIYFAEAEGLIAHLDQVSVEGGEPAPAPIPFQAWSLAGISPVHRSSSFLPSGIRCPTRVTGAPLWSVSLPAGQPRRIGTLMGADASWSPDGSEILLCRNREIYRASADGGNLRKIANVNGLPHRRPEDPPSDGHPWFRRIVLAPLVA